MIYLDYAASTPVDPEVFKEFKDLVDKQYSNPSSTHILGQKSRYLIDKSRQDIASIFNCLPKEIIFTSCATESNNLLIQGLVCHYLNYLKKDSIHLIFSQIEHASILNCLDFYKSLIAQNKLKIDLLKVDKNGLIQTQDLIKKVRKDTILVSIGMANGEIGVVQDISKASQILKTINQERLDKGLAKIFLHTDAVQASNYYNLNTKLLGVDSLTISSHKIYSPKGSSALFLSTEVPARKIFFGGEQEYDLRGGTQNLPTIRAMAVALKICNENQHLESQRLVKIRDFLAKKILASGLQIEINGYFEFGDLQKRSPANLSLFFKNVDQQDLLTYLDLQGFAISAGSACASGSVRASKVIQAIRPNLQKSDSYLRVSLGRFTTLDQVIAFADSLLKFIDSY